MGVICVAILDHVSDHFPFGGGRLGHVACQLGAARESVHGEFVELGVAKF